MTYTLEDGSMVTKIPINYTGTFKDIWGAKWWYSHGNIHRTNGPAYEGDNGSKWWYHHNKIHRLAATAFENADESEYYHNDQQLTNETIVILLYSTSPSK